MIQKLINRADIISDLVNNIAPNYLPDESLDKSRIGVFGYITEALAKSIEDTIVLEQRRAENYCPELSSSSIHVRQTAKIRGVGVNRAKPGTCYAIIGIMKDDILEKGEKINNEIHFIVDRRSTITNNGITFSLEDDILIRAVRNSTGYVYAANYVGEYASYNSYIQIFEQDNEEGEHMITLMLMLYQYSYNIQEKTVTDDLEFLYDGISFDYENKLADFDVYFKQSYGNDYEKLDVRHYLTNEAIDRYIYYNDDEDNILYILNNPILGINTNATIRVEIKETLGTDGQVAVGEGVATFDLYRDSSYNYSGVNISVTILTDTAGAEDGDTISDIKTALIDAKVRRDNITTELDIVNFINDIDANVQIVKKRNDIEDRIYYMYTLMRLDDEIVPATTKRLEIDGIASETELGDFDIYNPTVDRKVIKADNKFKLNIVEGELDSDYVTKVHPGDEIDPNGFYVTCPYMMLIDQRNILSYYYNSTNSTVLMHTKTVNGVFPYQVIAREVKIYRDAHSDTEPDTYKFSIYGTLNTANDKQLLNDDGTLKGDDIIIGILVFQNGGNDCAYTKVTISDYSVRTREFIFTGSFKTNDYLTENGKLEITEGLFAPKSEINYGSVIDCIDSYFTLYFMYKNDDENPVEYTKSDSIYTFLPESITDNYTLMNCYYNKENNICNLIIPLNKFSNSPTKMTKLTDTSFHYSIGEVPFIEYEFGKEHTADLFSEIEKFSDIYTTMLKLTTDFEVSLKFIATYGQSKYITVSGGYDNKSESESVRDLANLNPTFYFKIYGVNPPVEEIRDYIHVYLRDTYITGNTIFISNICTQIEEKFNIKSIKYLGVDEFDASYQEFTYNQPKFTNVDGVMRYIPEQLNVTNIVLFIDEN